MTSVVEYRVQPLWPFSSLFQLQPFLRNSQGKIWWVCCEKAGFLRRWGKTEESPVTNYRWKYPLRKLCAKFQTGQNFNHVSYEFCTLACAVVLASTRLKNFTENGIDFENL